MVCEPITKTFVVLSALLNHSGLQMPGKKSILDVLSTISSSVNRHRSLFAALDTAAKSLGH
jgi:hypothetical protein